MEQNSSGSGGGDAGMFVQNVVVMRHGDRMDKAQPLWAARADRPWDPPLVETGKLRSWTAGNKLRGVGFPIHRVVVSPFLRCLQTAREVISALSAGEDGGGLVAMETSEGVVIDPSSVKVSIEYGLCEVFGPAAISPSLVPRDGNWFPSVPELEALLPPGTIDHSVERIYKTMPCYGEAIADARRRYENVVVALADKFPNENLLLVTHDECVGVSISAFMKGVVVFEVEYCARSHLQRRLVSSSPYHACQAEPFVVLTRSRQDGICYFSPT